MKLYNSNLSPFASRCRMQIYAKGLNIELADPPENYADINPIGKIPCLHYLNDEKENQILPESDAICEYIEGLYPKPALKHASADNNAKNILLGRIADFYISTPLFELFAHLDPSVRDQAVVDVRLAGLKKGLADLDYFISGPDYAISDRLSLADCTLVPTLFFVEFIASVFDEISIANYPKVAAYWKSIKTNEFAARILGEMQEALQAYMSK